jgi:hypothetical protein
MNSPSPQNEHIFLVYLGSCGRDHAACRDVGLMPATSTQSVLHDLTPSKAANMSEDDFPIEWLACRYLYASFQIPETLTLTFEKLKHKKTYTEKSQYRKKQGEGDRNKMVEKLGQVESGLEARTGKSLLRTMPGEGNNRTEKSRWEKNSNNWDVKGSRRTTWKDARTLGCVNNWDGKRRDRRKTICNRLLEPHEIARNRNVRGMLRNTNLLKSAFGATASGDRISSTVEASPQERSLQGCERRYHVGPWSWDSCRQKCFENGLSSS